jgi:hypothetical protein
MREIRQSGSEGGGAQLNEPLLPLSRPTVAVVRLVSDSGESERQSDSGESLYAPD